MDKLTIRYIDNNDQEHIVEINPKKQKTKGMIWKFEIQGQIEEISFMTIGYVYNQIKKFR